MCNINIVLKKDNIPSKKLSEYMNVASYNSFIANDDGEGFLGIGKETVFKKSKYKLRFNGAYWFLASHQRMATSGYGENNIQPIPTKNLVLMHNGVFSGLGDQKKSDTYYYLDLLDRYYEKYNGNLKRAIKKTNSKVGGSYSILVYDRNTKQIFYYKEPYTDMYFVNSRDYLIMSTKRHNVEYSKFLFGIDKPIKEAKSGVIYDVMKNLNYVTTFKEKMGERGGWEVEDTSGYYAKNGDYIGNFSGKGTYSEKTKVVDCWDCMQSQRVHVQSVYFKCIHCCSHNYLDKEDDESKEEEEGEITQIDNINAKAISTLFREHPVVEGYEQPFNSFKSGRNKKLEEQGYILLDENKDMYVYSHPETGTMLYEVKEDL